MLKLLKSEKTVYTDQKTGNDVWKMTAGSATDVSCYPEAEAFTDDERFLVFISNRTGTFQLYRADVASGELAQLSDVEGFNAESFAMAPNGQEALFTAGWHVHAIDVDRGEERRVIDFEEKVPAPPAGGTVALSSSGNRMVFVGRPSNVAPILFMANLETGDVQELYRLEPGKITHPQICPSDPNLVTFDPAPDLQNDMTLPPDKRSRTWRLNVETGEAEPFLTAPIGFRATHEYWDRVGERLYFHVKKTPGSRPTRICSMNREGDDVRIHVENPTRKLGHSSIDRTASFIVSDVQTKDENELYHIDLATGEATILCWPNSDGDVKDQTHHVHPSISARGSYVDFTSDRAGTPDLYVYPLGQ